MKKLSTLLLTVLILSACQNNPSKETEKRTKRENSSKGDEINYCICMEIYRPVCGEDGKTYANACEAECQGVRYEEGPCEE